MSDPHSTGGWLVGCTFWITGGQFILYNSWGCAWPKIFCFSGRKATRESLFLVGGDWRCVLSLVLPMPGHISIFSPADIFDSCFFQSSVCISFPLCFLHLILEAGAFCSKDLQRKSLRFLCPKFKDTNGLNLCIKCFISNACRWALTFLLANGLAKRVFEGARPQVVRLQEQQHGFDFGWCAEACIHRIVPGVYLSISIVISHFEGAVLSSFNEIRSNLWFGLLGRWISHGFQSVGSFRSF